LPKPERWFAVAALEALAWAWLTGGRAGARPSQMRPRQARHFRWELCVALGLLVVVAVAGGIASQTPPSRLIALLLSTCGGFMLQYAHD